MASTLLTRLKTAKAVGALAVLAALAIAGSMRWPLADETVASRLQSALGKSSGYIVENIGEASFAALPWPSIQITGLSLRKPGSPHERVDAALLKARINLASWVLGEPRVSGVTLFDPVVNLASSENLGDTEAMSTAILNFISQDGGRGIRNLRIERGVVQLDGKSWLTSLRFVVSKPAGSDIQFEGEATRAGLPITLKAEVGGGSSHARRPIAWSIATPAFNAQFSGLLFEPRTLDAEGKLSASVTDGSRLADHFGLDRAHATALDGVRLGGAARIAWPMIQMRDAFIQQQGNRLKGSLEFSVDLSRPTLSATLDSDRLDVTPFLTAIGGQAFAEDGSWAEAMLPTGWLSAASADVRISAARLAAGPYLFDAAAFSAQLGAGRMELVLSDARLRSGSLKGRLSLAAHAAGGVELRAQASVDRVDLSQLLTPFRSDRVRGSMSGHVAMAAAGSTVAGLVGALDGRAHASVRDGDLPWFDLDRLSARPERSAAATLHLDGRTRFQSLALQWRIDKGSFHLVDGALTTPSMKAALDGVVSLRDRTIALGIRLPSAAEPPRGGDLRLRLEGPLAAPALTPDAPGRFNRS